MVFPFHRASQKTDSPRSHGRITTVIALFLMALLAGGLFFQNTALKAKEREKARQEEMVKRQQADKARALKKAKKETGVRLKCTLLTGCPVKRVHFSQPMSPGLPQSGQKSLPKGSTPSTPPQSPVQQPLHAAPPTPIKPIKPR